MNDRSDRRPPAEAEPGGSAQADFRPVGAIDEDADDGIRSLLRRVLVEGARDGVLAAAHDVSDGGVAQALIEMAMRSGIGADLAIPSDIDPFVFCCSESAGRAVVIVTPAQEGALRRLCAHHHVPVQRIGVVASGDEVSFGSFAFGLEELRRVHEATIPAALAG